MPPEALQPVGTKAIYVTYVRTHSILSLLAMVQQHAKAAAGAGIDDDVYIWLDFLALPQQLPTEEALEHVVAALDASVGSLIILDAAGEMFTRSWCNFEIYIAATKARADDNPAH